MDVVQATVYKAPITDLESKIRFASYMNVQCVSEFGYPLQGDIFLNGTIYRFKDGLLDGGYREAIACEDGHLEYWTKGKPHKSSGYALITDYGKWVEEWKNGNLKMIIPQYGFNSIKEESNE